MSSQVFPFPPKALSATHERILCVLGMTQRPLQSEELQQALGLLTNETHHACQWLAHRGYIVQCTDEGAPGAEPSWTLAEKGRSWAKEHGALAECATGEPPAWLQHDFRLAM